MKNWTRKGLRQVNQNSIRKYGFPNKWLRKLKKLNLPMVKTSFGQNSIKEIQFPKNSDNWNPRGLSPVIDKTQLKESCFQTKCVKDLKNWFCKCLRPVLEKTRPKKSHFLRKVTISWKTEIVEHCQKKVSPDDSCNWVRMLDLI